MGHVVVGQVTLSQQAKWTRGTPGRRFVSGNAPDNAERRHSDVYSSPPFISRRGAGPGA